jgi:hypothetical protein
VRREKRNEPLKVLVGFLAHGVLEILAQGDVSSVVPIEGVQLCIGVLESEWQG